MRTHDTHPLRWFTGPAGTVLSSSGATMIT
jgi:hypothetical protein